MLRKQQVVGSSPTTGSIVEGIRTRRADGCAACYVSVVLSCESLCESFGTLRKLSRYFSRRADFSTAARQNSAIDRKPPSAAALRIRSRSSSVTSSRKFTRFISAYSVDIAYTQYTTLVKRLRATSLVRALPVPCALRRAWRGCSAHGCSFSCPTQRCNRVSHPACSSP